MSTQNVNIARFAHNFECDFFCDFQPLWCCCFCSVILWAWITQNPFACHAFISFQVSISSKQIIHSKKNGHFLGHGNISYGLNRILWFFPTVHFEKTIQVRNCLLTCFSNRSINSHVNCDDKDLKNTKSIILPHFFFFQKNQFWQKLLKSFFWIFVPKYDAYCFQKFQFSKHLNFGQKNHDFR